MNTLARVAVFGASGVVTGLLCWAGGMALPEGSLVLQVYPGFVFGAGLFVAGRLARVDVARPWIASLAAIVLAGTASWRAAVDIGYMHGAPLPMLAAGALGGLVVAVGAVWAWRARRAVLTIVAAVLAGALGGQLADFLWDAFPGMGDDAWTLVLFLEWQTLVSVALALAVPVPGRWR